MSELDEKEKLKKKKAEEWELSRLRSYLAYPSWKSNTAVWVIASADPENSNYSDRQGYDIRWLPNGFRKNWETIPASAAIESFFDEVKYIEGFIFGRPRPPHKWISKALKNDYTPVWLELAKQDSQCSKYLPSKTVKAKRDKSLREHQSNAGKAAAANNKAHTILKDIKNNHFPDWMKTCDKQPNGRPTTDAIDEFVTKMQNQKKYEENLNTTTLVNRLYRWIKEYLSIRKSKK